MEVFTIDLTLNLMLPLVVLTHVTTRSSESMDSSINYEFVAHKRSSL